MLTHGNNIIGITSTVPVEVIYASGHVPVDVNNLFIASEDPGRLVRIAKKDGFPDTTCSWICGLYGAIRETGIKKVVGVVGGDCAETIALMEVLSLRDVTVIPFAYPHIRDRELLTREIKSFARRLDTDMDRAAREKKRLDAVRARVHRLDELLWKEDRARGGEVSPFELSTSDFEGDPEGFSKSVEEKISEVETRPPLPDSVRIGFLGVPPIIRDLYERIEDLGARIVYNEVQRQFSLPGGGSLVDSYHRYTYPYGIFARLEDIEHEIQCRRIDGVLHYVQAFCFRGIEDLAVRRKLNIPVLTLQGDLPTKVTETMQIRLEAFIDMLNRRKKSR